MNPGLAVFSMTAGKRIVSEEAAGNESHSADVVSELASATGDGRCV
jgi:hypothetical protein